jgi:hypothetical protein
MENFNQRILDPLQIYLEVKDSKSLVLWADTLTLGCNPR